MKKLFKLTGVSVLFVIGYGVFFADKNYELSPSTKKLLIFEEDCLAIACHHSISLIDVYSLKKQHCGYLTGDGYFFEDLETHWSKDEQHVMWQAKDRNGALDLEPTCRVVPAKTTPITP